MTPFTPLEELVSIAGGGTPNRARSDYYNGPIPWVTPKDMKLWDIHQSQETITEMGLKESAARLIPPGSVLIVIRSGVLKHTLPIAITRRPVAINQDMKALVPRPGVDAEYIAQFIQSSSPRVLNWVRATTADNFPLDELKALGVPLPNLIEQLRIARQLQRADKARHMRRYALQMCDEFQLNLFREQLRVCKTNTTQLGDICLRITDGVHITPTYVTNGIPFLRVTDIQDDEINWTRVKRIPRNEYDDITRRSKPEYGDILYSKNGTIGIAKEITWRVPFAHFVSLALLKPNRQRVHSSFLTAWLNTPDALQQATGHSKTGTVTNLHLNEIIKMTVPLPSVDEQEKFVEFIESAKSLRAIHVEALRQADHLFQTLLHQAFST